jgi:eukaryotic-like serine/threonine-protein kinase
MSKKIGRFEILSEIQHGDVSSVYKASDPEGGRIVALKTIRLEMLGEQAEALAASILEEIQASQVLNSHNVTLIYGTEDIDGSLCVSMEYVQGNSIATMLARKEGFSIWDLQDIARQSCQGLDHASARQVFHYALEPAKIMVQWDGTVKVLGYGVSRTGLYAAAQAKGKPPQILHYMSPEQVGGDTVDARSNLFSLGTILYEMVTDRKAFEGEDADQVRQAILESEPTPVGAINPTVHAGLEAVIMKALAKDPQQRFQSGQELVADLERCKSSTGGAAAARKPAAPSSTKPAETAAAAPLARAAAASQGGLSGSFPQASAACLAGASPVEAQEEAATMTVADRPAETAGAVDEPPAVESPRFTIDPMVDEDRQPETSRPSFSEVDELPPLKQAHVEPEAPAAPPEPADPVRAAVFHRAEAPKDKATPRELAKQAVHEIRRTPPQLFVYAIAAAAVVILLVVIGIAYHIHAGESDDDNQPVQSAAPPTPAPALPPAQSAAPQAAAPAPPRVLRQVIPEAPAEKMPAVSVKPKYDSKKNRAKLAKVVPPLAPGIVPGQLNVDSNPAGAQVSLDGQSTGAVTPFSLANLTPGHHTITLSKNGFASETRGVDVASGSRSMISVQLAPTTAMVAADSDPQGAAIWIDGKDSGRVTPARISLEKPGPHSFVFKKQGYLDETASANVPMGQTFELAPKLRALGTTDEIKIGGRFKKVFGGSETAGMGVVSVKTQPKGAQVAVNNRLLDKMSPVEFYLNPGNYVIDITLSGFKTVERVITVERNGKLVIEESLERE